MTYHEPVLLHECIAALEIKPNGIYADATFGGGGHTKEILKHLKNGKVIGFDQDADAAVNAVADKRFTLVRDNFRYMLSQLEQMQCLPLDGLLADLGISSHQINEPARGFSTRFEAALDMRMNQSTSLTAAQVINTYSEKELTNIFSMYGEIRNSKTLALTIVNARAKNAIETIEELKSAIANCVSKDKQHQYHAQVFQALRIEVNDELGALRDLLEQCPQLIKQGGRLVVISYHSLEDRLVKNFFATGNVNGEVNKDLFGNTLGVSFQSLTKKPITPTTEELKINTRSRSAKLRIAQKL